MLSGGEPPGSALEDIDQQTSTRIADKLTEQNAGEVAERLKAAVC